MRALVSALGIRDRDGALGVGVCVTARAGVVLCGGVTLAVCCCAGTGGGFNATFFLQALTVRHAAAAIIAASNLIFTLYSSRRLGFLINDVAIGDRTQSCLSCIFGP